MSGADPLTGLIVTTPWYPSLHNPVSGSFVTDWTGLARSLTDRVRVVHAEEWPGGDVDTVARVRPHAHRVLDRMSSRNELDVNGRWATLTRVPTIITSGFDVPDRADAAVDSTRVFGGALDTPVVHGHVGYLGGLMAARLADPASRVVVTEHSTGLEDFLTSARGRDMYAEVLERSHRLTCVSGPVRDLILSACPGYDETVIVVPNPVNFEPTHQRSARPQRLDRWVYSGGLIERKGVVRVVRAFARFAAGRPSATLDLYGQGPLEDQLRDIAGQADVGHRIRFRGNVSHDEMLKALTHHDVLVAPSHYETFHLVVPEAVAAGIPVVVTRSGGPQEALAGVEDLVGRFIDVNDDADELLEAVLDLEAGLDQIDLPRARAALAARYGHDAFRATLAQLYGCADRRLDTTMQAVAPAPREHVIISVSGWRRYAVKAQLETLAQGHAPATLLTNDDALLASHRDVSQGSPADYVRELVAVAGMTPRVVARRSWPYAVEAARAGLGLIRGTAQRSRANPRESARPFVQSLGGAARRVAAGLRRDVRTLITAARSRRSGSNVEEPAVGPRPHAVHVVADVASFPLVASLLDAQQDVHLAVEPDRWLLGLSPVDAA